MIEPVDSRKDIDGERNIRHREKQAPRGAIARFRVAFVLSNVAAASENNPPLNLGNTAGSATGITPSGPCMERLGPVPAE